MIELVVIGAGGLGREIFSWITIASSEYNIVGFVDDNPHKLSNYNYSCKIISNLEEYKPTKGVLHVLAIMNPTSKKNVIQKLKDKDCEFLTFIHPNTIIGRNVEVGEGCVITPNCILSTDIKLGKFVFLNTNTTVGHDVCIGDYASVNGKVEIGGDVNIGNEVLVGSRAVILPRVKIVASTIVGTGSVVVTNIKKPVTVFGNPAREI